LAALLLYNKKQTMAINVNTVYTTVLSILNKEQRGYMTPAEFNTVGAQVQLQIFEKYFEDLNQQLRVPQTDVNYGDRVDNVDEKIAIFKTFGNAVHPPILSNGQNPTNSAGIAFSLPETDAYTNEVEFYRLGEVSYKNEVLVQKLQRNDFYSSEKSKLTKATETFPTYLYENELLFVRPTSITSDIQVEYVRKPLPPIWGFIVGSLGQYEYSPSNYIAGSTTVPGTGSRDFELHISEQVDVILRILAYAGIIIRDPQIVQQALQQVQSDEINSKS
tara:strand:- start:499 stop:1323 length:825 start_codon:yes stop_codon:yes gene_type:complete